MLQALFFRHFERRPFIELIDEAGERFAALLEHFRIVRFDFFLLLRIYRTVSERATVIRGTLEYGQVVNVFRNFGDELDTAGASTDDTDTLTAEVYRLLWPGGGMVYRPESSRSLQAWGYTGLTEPRLR